MHYGWKLKYKKPKPIKPPRSPAVSLPLTIDQLREKADAYLPLSSLTTDNVLHMGKRNRKALARQLKREIKDL
jgi:hypothetical protein